MTRHEVTIVRGNQTLLAVPVLDDNYVYLVCRNRQAVLIDAGEAAPVQRALDRYDWTLRDIRLTHHHGDHRAGYDELIRRQEARDPAAAGPVEAIPVPGHTAGDTAFYFPEAGAVFSGDCLINGACGRVFGGTAAQLFESLQRIAALPDQTLVFGGHDYLEDNLRFGLHIEPENADIRSRLELYGRDPAAALFVSLAEERKTNPFLRAASVEEFTALRNAKDRF